MGRIIKLYKGILGEFIPEYPPDFKNLFIYIYSILECKGYNPPSLFAEIHETNNHLFGISDKHQTNCIL